MPRSPDPAPQKTRERVRSAAFRLFGQFGYDGVSMLTVARAAEITKAALYWHYDSKQALYADCMRKLVSIFEARVFTPAADEHAPVERILTLFSGLGRLADDARLTHGVAGYWLTPSTADVAEARAVQQEFEEMAEAAIEYTLDEARQSGALTIEGETRDMAHAFIALMEAIVLPLAGRSGDEHRRVVAVLAQIFFKAHAPDAQLAARAAAALAPDAAATDPQRQQAAGGHG